MSRRIAFALAAMLAVSGCSAQSVSTTLPATGTQSATPAVPSQAASPTATAEPTASPTPEITPNPDMMTKARLVAQIQSGEAPTLYPNVKGSALATLYDALTATDPSIDPIIFFGHGQSDITSCTTSLDPAVREVACWQLIANVFDTTAKSDSKQAEDFLKGLVGYDIHNLRTDEWNWVVTRLQK